MRSPILFESVLEATPAYGRTYADSVELLAAWNGGKDFRIKNGPYFSIRNLEQLKREYTHIHFHWTVFKFGFAAEPTHHVFVLELK